MSKPINKTAFLGFLALVAASVAAWFYPWPERVVENELVGQSLFEEYDASAVRSISILKYDTDRNELERFELVRNGEKWIIPARNNFVATNSAQISMVVNSLNNRTVLEIRSNEKSDHNTFGVVDPAEIESASNRASLGTKITLLNHKKQELASLIVGETLGGKTDLLKRFARVPGQPNVYVLDFDKSVLTTDFKRWTSPNLMQISEATGFNSVDVKNYRIEKNKLTTDEKKWVYQANNFPNNETFELLAPDQDGEFFKVPPTAEIAGTLNQFLQEKVANGRLVRPPFVQYVRFTDVQKKSSAAAAALRGLPREDNTTNELDSLQDYGFAKSGFTNKLEFNAVGGQTIVRTQDSVSVSIYFGSLVENSTGGDFSLNYNVMLYASVDESLIPEPEKPATSDVASKAESDEKAYLKAVKKRNEVLDAARRRASELNTSFAKWYYVVPEEVINGLRPELILPAAPKKTKEVAKKPDAKKEEAKKEAKEGEAKEDEAKKEGEAQSTPESDSESESDDRAKNDEQEETKPEKEGTSDENSAEKAEAAGGGQ